MKLSIRSLIAAILSVALMVPMAATALATESIPEAVVTIDNEQVRETVCDGVTALYNKKSNVMTITYADGTSTTFEVTDTPAIPSQDYSTRVEVTELERLNVYSKRVTENDNYFWGIDALGQGELLVWATDDIASYCEDFKDYIIAADDSNALLLVSGIVGAAAIAVGIITGPAAPATATAAKAAFVAALKGLGIVANAGVIAAFAGVWSKLSHTRDCYDAVKAIFLKPNMTQAKGYQ